MAGWGAQAWGADESDGQGPQIVNMTPVEGPTTPYQPIEFDVIDLTPDLQDVFIWAWFEGIHGRFVIHDEDGFPVPFAAGSTKVVIANGYHFKVYRDGGWLGSTLFLRVRAFDAQGNTV